MSRLDRLFDDAERRSDDLVQKAIQNLLAPQRSGMESAVADMLGKSITAQNQVSIDHHREQLRHYTGWVAAAVKLIAQRIAKQRFIVARHVIHGKKLDKINNPNKMHTPSPFKAFHLDLDVIEDHPLLDVMKQPNEIMTRWSLFFVLVVALELTGKAFWWIYDAPKGSSLEGRKVIWPVPPHWIDPVHENGQLYTQWKIKPDGMREPLIVPGNEIIYFFYPDASNPLGAQSTLQTIARSVVADEAITEAQRRTFLNDIWPGLALIIGRNPDMKTPGVPNERPVLTKEQRAMTIAAVKNAYRGVQNFNEPLILDGFIEDVKRVTVSAREMDFMNSGKYTKERITQGFNVNPIIMGEIEGANRASSAAADSQHCDSCINPKITFLSECMTMSLVPLFAAPGENLVAYLEEAIPSDPDTDRANREQLARYGAISINEMRLANNLPPIHGGDVALVLGQWVPIRVIREDAPLPEGDGVVLLPDQSDRPEQPAQPAAPVVSGKPPGQAPQPNDGNKPKPPDAQNTPAKRDLAHSVTTNGVHDAPLLEVPPLS